jgi:hypothetical protein
MIGLVGVPTMAPTEKLTRKTWWDQVTTHPFLSALLSGLILAAIGVPLGVWTNVLSAKYLKPDNEAQGPKAPDPPDPTPHIPPGRVVPEPQPTKPADSPLKFKRIADENHPLSGPQKGTIGFKLENTSDKLITIVGGQFTAGAELSPRGLVSIPYERNELISAPQDVIVDLTDPREGDQIGVPLNFAIAPKSVKDFRIWFRSSRYGDRPSMKGCRLRVYFEEGNATSKEFDVEVDSSTPNEENLRLKKEAEKSREAQNKDKSMSTPEKESLTSSTHEEKAPAKPDNPFQTGTTWSGTSFQISDGGVNPRTNDGAQFQVELTIKRHDAKQFEGLIRYPQVIDAQGRRVRWGATSSIHGTYQDGNVTLRATPDFVPAGTILLPGTWTGTVEDSTFTGESRGNNNSRSEFTLRQRPATKRSMPNK